MSLERNADIKAHLKEYFELVSVAYAAWFFLLFISGLFPFYPPNQWKESFFVLSFPLFVGFIVLCLPYRYGDTTDNSVSDMEHIDGK